MKLNKTIIKLSPEDVFPADLSGTPDIEEHRNYYFTKTKGLKSKTLAALKSKSSSEQLARDLIQHINNEIIKKKKLILTEEKSSSDLIDMVTL